MVSSEIWLIQSQLKRVALVYLIEYFIYKIGLLTLVYARDNACKWDDYELVAPLH